MESVRFEKGTSEDQFYREARIRAKAVLGRATGTNAAFWLKALFFFTLCWGTYALILSGALHGGAAVLGAVVVGISGLLMGFSVGHDASHGVIAKQRWINTTLHFLSFLTIGIDPLLWGLRHIRSHHICPNVVGSDIDIDHNPLIRLSPDHPWRPRHRFQHFYAPFGYSVALLHSLIWGDWMYLISSEYRWMRRGVRSSTLWLSFLGFKAVHVTLMIVLPTLFLDYSLWMVLAVYLGVGAITSLLFIVMLVGTHFFEEASFPRAEGGANEIAGSWSEHALRTSCDWNPESPLARFFSGGANCHAAHHLFPRVCHTHYGKLNGILRELSVAHDVPYHALSLPAMVCSHFRLLRRLGVRPF